MNNVLNLSNHLGNGQKKALYIFQQAAVKVPAYRKFLKIHKINPSYVKTAADFKNIPLTDKKNYIDRYPLTELAWNGDLSKNTVINSSSGSTGIPYYWPCSYEEYRFGAKYHQWIYNNMFRMNGVKNLLIICFGMGTWVAGSFTLFSSYLVKETGLPLTIMTPGFNKDETLRILSEVSPLFDQTIIAGIPTFIKDLMELWRQNKNYSKVKSIKFLFSGEGFSENWRDYVLRLVKSNNYKTDAVSVLGSAEGAFMAFETPQSITIRRYSIKNLKLRRELFGSERIPSLHNYIPDHRYFEKVANELILTANRSIPLIRYNIHDQGGIIEYSSIKYLLKKYDKTLPANLFLPYIYIFGRGKFVATLYAANIYPENVRDVLLDKSVRKFITGQFTMETKYDKKQTHTLNINIELKKGLSPAPDLADKTADIFMKKVRLLNSEYNRIVAEYGVKAKPHIILKKYQDKTFFPEGKIKKTS